MPSQRPGKAGSAGSVQTLMRQGETLARAPRLQRDIRWHVAAALIGDFPALVAARIRAEPGRR